MQASTETVYLDLPAASPMLFAAVAFVVLAAVAITFLVRRALYRRKAQDEANRRALESLRDEVWELKAAEAARERAEAASEAKSRFIATVSHEIRTPLNGLLGMAELLASTSLNAEQGTYVEAIRSSGAALASLIDEILDFSKIEAGKLELAREPFDLAGLVEGVVELLAPRAQGKGLDIASFIAADLPTRVVGDAARLRQVLLNLAGNAVKFTSAGGVGLRVTKSEDKLEFAVIDTGPGIPEQGRQAIFAEFEQGDGSTTRRHEGTGLGLAISQRLAEAMGGSCGSSEVLPKARPFPSVLPCRPRLARIGLGDPPNWPADALSSLRRHLSVRPISAKNWKKRALWFAVRRVRLRAWPICGLIPRLSPISSSSIVRWASARRKTSVKLLLRQASRRGSRCFRHTNGAHSIKMRSAAMADGSSNLYARARSLRGSGRRRVRPRTHPPVLSRTLPSICRIAEFCSPKTMTSML